MPSASTAASSRASISRTASASGRADATVTANSSGYPTRTCCWCCRRRASWRWLRRPPASSRSWRGSRRSRARPGTTRCWSATSCWFATARRWSRSGCPPRAADGAGRRSTSDSTPDLYPCAVSRPSRGHTSRPSARRRDHVARTFDLDQNRVVALHYKGVLLPGSEHAISLRLALQHSDLKPELLAALDEVVWIRLLLNEQITLRRASLQIPLQAAMLLNGIQDFCAFRLYDRAAAANPDFASNRSVSEQAVNCCRQRPRLFQYFAQIPAQQLLRSRLRQLPLVQLELENSIDALDFTVAEERHQFLRRQVCAGKHTQVGEHFEIDGRRR